MDLKTGSIHEKRGGNVFFHEQFTASNAYVRQLLLNVYGDGNADLPSEIPVVPMLTILEDRLPPVAADSPQSTTIDKMVQHCEPELIPSYEQVGVQDGPGPKPRNEKGSNPLPAKSKGSKQAKRRRLRKSDEDSDEPDDPDEPPKKSPAATLHPDSRARRARKLPAHLKEYVVGSVINTTVEIPIPNTYKQAKRSDHWPEWEAAMQEELESLRQHGTWKLVARAKAKNQAVITNRWLYTVQRDAEG